MYIGMVKTREVKTPARAHPHDAGIDFFIPEDFKNVWLHPGESTVIPSGIKVEIPIGYAGVFHNKSGVASKRGLLIGAQVIDTYYEGEVHINLHNVGVNSQEIKPGMKAAQMLLISVATPQIIEINKNQLYENFLEKNYREENGFGSSGE